MPDKRTLIGFGLLALLLMGRKSMAKKPTDMQLSPHFRLSEFLRSSAVPEVAYYKPTAEEIARLKLLCEDVLEPLRAYVGRPIRITGGARPESVRNAAGQTFYEALTAKGYVPASNSDHERFIGVDVTFRGGAAEYKRAFEWLKSRPDVRQVGIYFKSVGDGSAAIPDHLHISVVAPGYPRLTSAFSYARIDNRKVSEANV